MILYCNCLDLFCCLWACLCCFLFGYEFVSVGLLGFCLICCVCAFVYLIYVYVVCLITIVVVLFGCLGLCLLGLLLDGC